MTRHDIDEPAEQLFRRIRDKAIPRMRELEWVIVNDGEPLPSPRQVGHGTTAGDPTATKAITRIVNLARARVEHRRLEDLVGYAGELCAGVSRALGEQHGEVLDRYYLSPPPQSWEGVAVDMGIGPRWAQELKRRAFDYIDTVGHERARRGEPVE